MREAIPAANSAVRSANASQGAGAAHGISLGEATRVWTRIALLSFGGPAGQIAVMHRILV
jgi:chromate transporter